MLIGDEARRQWEWRPYFAPSEFECRCGCGLLKISPHFMARLFAIRVEFGHPMVVTSGTRCPAHNQRVAKSGPRGPHTIPYNQGQAADIGIYGGRAHQLAKLGLLHGMTGVGVAQMLRLPYQSRFIHFDTLDDRPDCPRPWLWSY